MEKRPTLKTIGQLAGLSHVAVSKALRDAPDISEATKARVKKIAEELGYENSSYFAKLFRTRYGMTPLEYRRRPGTPPQPSSKL